MFCVFKLAFLAWTLFGLLFKKLGKLLFKSSGHSGGGKDREKKIKKALRGFPQMFNNDECFFTQKDRAYKCTYI